MRLYTGPAPGTVAGRAIAILRALPPGGEMTSGGLCREMGSSARGFNPYMKQALRDGLVLARKQPNPIRPKGFEFMWSAGLGVPEPIQDHAPKAIDGRRIVDKALETVAAARFVPRSVFHFAEMTA